MRFLSLTCLLACVLAFVVPAQASASPNVLRTYAADTWRSMAAMVEPSTGVPADKITGDLRTRAKVTSPTNVGGYLWSSLAARDIGLISSAEAEARVARALRSLGQLTRHKGSGQFYNWYDPATLRQVTTWPEDGSTVKQFLSSVDNGWLAAALMMVRNALPRQAGTAGRILDGMDFRSYYDPKAASNGTGLLRGGFWEAPPDPTCSIKGNYTGNGPDVYYTCHTYGAPGETRIASYVGIARGQLPPQHYFGLLRTMGDQGCDFGWQEQKPQGGYKTYLGIRVYEGTYSYRGKRFVPTWGGSMFEELMPNLLVPEQSWGAA